MVVVREGRMEDAAGVAEMCSLLWPEATVLENLPDVEAVLRTGRYGTLPGVVLVAEYAGELVGFLTVGLRSHADGCDMAQAVGFIEGWFVREAARRCGVGGALMRGAEEWARRQGCREMGSDTWIDHELSQQAHAGLGFEVVDRCVHFRKAL